MPDYERAMLAYVELAQLSHRKRQWLGRDKFLVLAAADACRAGWLEVARQCRDLILDNNAAHSVAQWPSMADALRDEAFQQFLGRLERFCSHEKAEHLLCELGIETGVPESQLPRDPGEYALDVLSGLQR